MSELVPAPVSHDPQVLLLRLVSYVSGLAGFADLHLIPAVPDMPRKMTRGKAGRLHQHICRLEYSLRCFILFLVSRFLESGQIAKRAEHASPQGPVSPKTHLERMEETQYFDYSDRVRIASFQVILPDWLEPGSRKTPSKPYRYRLLDPLAEIDVSLLLARLDRLGRVLKRTDQIAHRLAVRAITRAPAEKQPHGLHFKPLEAWLPPETLWESGTEEERADLNLLHYLAASGLAAQGFAHVPEAAYQLSIPPPLKPGIHTM